jgi:hypothetical protein
MPPGWGWCSDEQHPGRCRRQIRVLILHVPPVEIPERATRARQAAGHHVRTAFYAMPSSCGATVSFWPTLLAGLQAEPGYSSGVVGGCTMGAQSHQQVGQFVGVEQITRHWIES